MHNTPVRPRLRRAAAAAVLPLAALAGCSYDSPSAREDTGRDFSSYLYSIDTPINASPEARPGRLVLPAKLAVAQIGEVAPPSRFLEALRGHADVFERVEAISGAAGVGYDRRPVDCKDGVSPAEERARLEMARMQRVAREMGMGHLLLIGGTIDQATKENGLGILDATIVGAFVVPSKQVDAQARASGALIDLESGRVVLFASADASRSRLASTATEGAGEIDVVRDARDEVMSKLAGQLIQQCTQRGEQPL
jgi:rhombotail lipoprotein